MGVPGRSLIPVSVRDRVLRNGRCVYCGSPSTSGVLVVDHVFPVSRGGTDAEYNLAACCVPCNSEKGDSTVDEWRERRESRGLPWPVDRSTPPPRWGHAQAVLAGAVNLLTERMGDGQIVWGHWQGDRWLVRIEATPDEIAEALMTEVHRVEARTHIGGRT